MLTMLVKLDSHNLQLQNKMQSNVKATEEVDAEASGLLDNLEEVWSSLSIFHIPS